MRWKKVALYVVKDGKYSFKVNTQTYPALTNETEMKNVISTATSDPYKTKSFTWMSSPLAKEKAPVVQYAKKADYDKKGESSLQTATGTFTDQVFSGEQDPKKNGIVRVNEVDINRVATGYDLCLSCRRWYELVRYARIQHLKEEKNI